MKTRTRRDFLKVMGVAGTSLLRVPTGAQTRRELHRRPNIILILADDLGYSELGCYGQQRIQTPNIDELAKAGIRFTQHYSGSPVCAPSRCVLLTGMHSGHAYIRDNREIQPEGQFPIPSDTVTLPKLLKAEGYATAAIGKWGLGPPASSGDPNKQGFDLFFGYNCQRQAHNYYPRYLWRNNQRVELRGNDAGLTGKQYSLDLMETEALNFIRERRDHPFFLYFATTIPHLALQVPEDSLKQYQGKWDDPPYDGKKGYLPQRFPRATYAAMVTRLDRSVGRMVVLLEQLNLDKDTLILFTSDNGSTYDVGGYDPEFFRGTGPLRSHKGYVYEGGIRVPLIARWQGRIQAGRVSNHLSAFQDTLPTLLEVIGAKGRTPTQVDGISYAPTLLGIGNQQEHDYLYMEFPAYGGQQMVRSGDWKGVKQNLSQHADAPLELYNLRDDIGEVSDVARQHPDIVKRIQEIMRTAHRPSEEFPLSAVNGRKRTSRLLSANIIHSLAP